MRESLRRLAGSGSTSEEGMARAGRCTKRVRVQLLDGEYISIDVDRKARGVDLLDRICDDLDIVERDYFGVIRANQTEQRVWIDMERTLAKTFRNEPWEVRFVVKFYPPEPSELRDDNSRYQLSLAVRQDIMEGRSSFHVFSFYLVSYDLGTSCLRFRLPSTSACKLLWRCCVEHHIFFRRETPVCVERVLGFPRLGARRVSCRRTLQQLRARGTHTHCTEPPLVT
ncbi:PREDICTED: band 4.1-like protein 4B [Papilio polytes]|uniref:band 4.1-like protein 4B n=1 Tax=Papilio polytes TaxID=76194 RepID=UPI0006765EB1|nr:PREDICTED: band 4.1-like protein 4B [Papilio polytes]